MPTEIFVRFIHHVVFHSPATLAGIAIGGLGGAITGLWDPIGGCFIGLVLGFAASSALGLSWES